MPRVTTEALALRRTPFGETSQIAVFLTRSHGLLPLILKGVHRPRSRKGGAVDLLDHCQVSYSSRRGSRSMPQVNERKLLGHHPNLRRRSDLLLAGEYLVELLLGLIPEGQPVPRVFDLALAYLGALEAALPGQSLAPVVFALQGGILRLTGFELTLDRCISCNRRPTMKHVLRCDPDRGGIVCGRCRAGRDHSFSLSAVAASVIRQLAGSDPGHLTEIRLPTDIDHQLRRYYDRVITHVLERPPRCHVLHRVA
ncbi:MAG: DNA repair protein RecO (recombination protein O) [Pseudohongiellaceae bacterium]|jgi:DNA repair protein RecO (recombination protein O)